MRAVLSWAFLLAACATPSPPPPLRPEPVRPPPPPSIVWPYWQGVPVDVRPIAEEPSPELDPRPPSWLEADPGWSRVAPAIVARVREEGFALRRPEVDDSSLGEFYAERARKGAPLLITMDALFAISHLAFTAAAAGVEERVMRRDLSTVLHRLEVRLGAEAPRARPDLLEGYRIARTAVAVALALLEPTGLLPADVEADAEVEVGLVRAHAGLARSAVFGTPVDYGEMTPRGPLEGQTDPRAAAFLAAEWLGGAPFRFDSARGARVDVGSARNQARAALLLARLLIQAGDMEASAAAGHMAQIDRFALGESDALSPADVVSVATTTGIDLGGGSDIASVIRLDHFRHAASPPSMFLVPLRVSPDTRMLASRVDPLARRLPSRLDVGLWLRSSVDPYPHASAYGSMLEAVRTWLRPSAADQGSPQPFTDAYGRRKLQAALSAWALLRHDALPFAHDGARALATPTAVGTTPPELVFVEPHPEAIAALLGAVQQLRRGFVELGALGREQPARGVLAETESVLSVVLDAAVRTANRDPSVRALDAPLSLVPARIAALERATRPAGEPVVVDVHVDRGSGRVLEEGTGPVLESFVRVYDPELRRSLLAIGPAIPEAEIVGNAGARLDDRAWRSLLASGHRPRRDPISDPELVDSPGEP